MADNISKPQNSNTATRRPRPNPLQAQASAQSSSQMQLQSGSGRSAAAAARRADPPSAPASSGSARQPPAPVPAGAASKRALRQQRSDAAAHASHVASSSSSSAVATAAAAHQQQHQQQQQHRTGAAGGGGPSVRASTSGDSIHAHPHPAPRPQTQQGGGSAVGAGPRSHMDKLSSMSNNNDANSDELAAASTKQTAGEGGGGEDGLNTANQYTSQPLTGNLLKAVLVASVGASFQHGYNAGVVNAPEKLIDSFINDTFTRRLMNAASSAIDSNQTRDAFAGQSQQQTISDSERDLILALIVSIFCVGGAIGSLFSAPVGNYFGRKPSLLYSNLLVILAVPLQCLARPMHSYELLIFGRLIIGLSAGLNAGLAPLYLTEIAPSNWRGQLGSIYQLVIACSLLLSNIIGLPGLLGTDRLWPLLFAVPILPAILMLFLIPKYCMESPRHLILNEQSELRAQQALAWFRETTDVQDEMEELRLERETLQNMQHTGATATIGPGTTSAPGAAINQQVGSVCAKLCKHALAPWQALLSEPRLRRALMVAVAMMLSQQLSGINAILFYSTAIFRESGLSSPVAIGATLGVGLVNVAMTIVALMLVERTGRRPLHMNGLLGMSAACLVLAICVGSGSSSSHSQSYATAGAGAGVSAAGNASSTDSNVAAQFHIMDSTYQAPGVLSTVLTCLAVYAFVAMFAIGPGAVPWLLVGELFPARARAYGSSVAVASNWLANFVVSLSFLPLTNLLHGGVFLIFALSSLLFHLFTRYKLPETRGATPDEIAALFSN